MKAMILSAALIAAVGAGVARSAPQALPPAPDAFASAPSEDPLTREILRAAVTRADGGLVTAIRLSPELTGVDHEQILTIGAHRR
jgi:hypothetical protein